MIVVSDATPLIALAKIRQLDLLQQLFGGIFIPQMVYDEVVTNAALRPGAVEISQAVGLVSVYLKIKTEWLICVLTWMRARRKHWFWLTN